MKLFGKRDQRSHISSRRGFLRLLVLAAMLPLFPNAAQPNLGDGQARPATSFQTWGEQKITLRELTMSYATLPWLGLDDADQRGLPQ